MARGSRDRALARAGPSPSDGSDDVDDEVAAFHKSADRLALNVDDDDSESGATSSEEEEEVLGGTSSEERDESEDDDDDDSEDGDGRLAQRECVGRERRAVVFVWGVAQGRRRGG